MGPEDINLLPVIRCEVDPVYGIKREDVLITEFDSEVYTHSLIHLANLICADEVEFKQATLPEMDERVRVDVLTVRGTMEYFREAIEDLDGYTYAPYGPGAMSFGYYCDHLFAWIVPHRDFPALIVRSRHDAEVSEFFKAADNLRGMLPPWPQRRAKPTVLEPIYRLPELRVRAGRKRLQPRKKIHNLTGRIR